MATTWDIRLKELARSGNMSQLEEAWLEALENPGPASTFLETLEAVGSNKREEYSIALLPLVLETFARLEQHEEALQIVRVLGLLQPKEPPLRRALVRHLRGAYPDTDWLEGFLQASGLLIGGCDLKEGLEKFDSYWLYKPGGGVQHGSGWGVGVIQRFNEDTWELVVKFEDDTVRELPLSTALDNLKVLDYDHIRVMSLTRPDELKALALEDPACMIKKALALFPNKVLNAARVKEVLVDQAVPAKAWAKWWPKAKKAAALDPYLLVEGGSRPTFKLRDKPVSIVEEAVESVQRARDLTDMVKRVRGYLAADPEEGLQEKLLSALEDQVNDDWDQEDTPILVEALVLFEEEGHDYDATVESLIRDTFEGDEEGWDTAEFFSEIPTDWGRTRSIRAFEDAFPENWAQLLAADYGHLPKGMIDAAGDALVKKGFGQELLDSFKKIMTAPWSTPWPLFFLCRRHAHNGFNGLEEIPSLAQSALALLKCLESPLFYTRGTIQERREVIRRYEELFFGPKTKLLKHLVDEGEREEVVRAVSMIHLTSKIPEEVQEFLRSEVSYRFPDLMHEEEKQFWEEDLIFCSKKGIDRRNAEFKKITDEKLPAIFKAIGKAAELGDLSENAEWTAAMEEQRLLTEKATEMEEELGLAREIEDQRWPEGMVAPGTRVTVKRESGEEETVTILGPWDVGEAGVVSYRAPVAASLLGGKAGDNVEVKLPEKSYNVEIISVEVLNLD